MPSTWSADWLFSPACWPRLHKSCHLPHNHRKQLVPNFLSFIIYTYITCTENILYMHTITQNVYCITQRPHHTCNRGEGHIHTGIISHLETQHTTHDAIYHRPHLICTHGTSHTYIILHTQCTPHTPHTNILSVLFFWRTLININRFFKFGLGFVGSNTIIWWVKD